MAIASRRSSEIALEAFRKLESGHMALKHEQMDSIVAILEKEDVFISLPTGFRKTIITAALPIAFDIARVRSAGYSIVLCVSPLVALIDDQKRRLIGMGLSVGILSSSIDILEQARAGSFQVLLSSPEMLLNNPVVRAILQSRILQERIVAIVIDEAHCISKWYVHVQILVTIVLYNEIGSSQG
jgi:superfamily II DNA helicase RecQ